MSGAALDAVSSRLNPILVKEVRQSLRGRYFGIVFWLMVAVAATIACLFLAQADFQRNDRGGQMFFVAMYGCLSVAVHLFVPFSTFLSVGSEWDENTYDLLVLSNLKPRQIVLGKLFSAVVQVGLFFCAFGPFLVFAFLLRGLDLVVAGWVLGLTVVSAVGLSAVSLALSSLVRQRLPRVLLMALLAIVLVWSTAGSIAFSVMVFEERIVHVPEFRLVAGGFTSGILVLGIFALLLAATRFTHTEENRSTGLRIFTTLVVLAATAWNAYLYRIHGEAEGVLAIAMMTLVGATVLGTVFSTEEESLGRRVRLQVPKQGALALLVAPFLPGGARGVLHYLLNVGLIALGVHLILFDWSGTGMAGRPTFLASMQSWVLGLGTYCMIYLLLPTALVARWTGELK